MRRAAKPGHSRRRGSRARAVGLALFAAALTIGGAAWAEAQPGGSAAPPSGAATTLAVQISVAANATMAPVPRSFLGLSTEYWSLPMWASEMPRLERVLALLRVPGGGPLVLRVGGDSADHAFWDPSQAGMPQWEFGIEPQLLGQLRALVRSEHVKLIIDLNLLTDTPAQAARWAAVAERSLPIGSIAAFEVGNEPDIYSRADWAAITAARGPDRALAAGPRLPRALSPRDYARDFLIFAAALHRIAPHVPIAGPALANPVTHARWLPALLHALRGRLGLVTIHRYPYSGCPHRTHSQDYATIARLLSPAASTGMARALDRNVRVARRAGLTLRMTELNSVNCGGRSGVSNSFATALWAPDALFALARTGVDGVNLHVRATTVNAPFLLTSAGLRPRPLLYGMILFARALGPHARLVALSSRHPRALDFSAWAVRVGARALHLVLIDKSRHAARITLRLPAAGPLTVQRLLAPSVRARGGVTFGGQVLGTDARWYGRAVAQTLTSTRGTYTVRVSGHSAALLTVEANRGALGVRSPAPAAG